MLFFFGGGGGGGGGGTRDWSRAFIGRRPHSPATMKASLSTYVCVCVKKPLPTYFDWATMARFCFNTVPASHHIIFTTPNANSAVASNHFFDRHLLVKDNLKIVNSIKQLQKTNQVNCLMTALFLPRFTGWDCFLAKETSME